MVTLEATPLIVNVAVGGTTANPIMWHQVALKEPNPRHNPYPTLALALAFSINQNRLLNNVALDSSTELISCYSTARREPYNR